jgi:hypothetical protein
MITVKLMGTPACRRYQKMRALVMIVADRLGVKLNLEEVSEVEILSRFSPLSLPRLCINGELVASQNPPKVQDLERRLAGIRLSIVF